MQYHVEVEPDTVANWGRVPAYLNALNATLGNGGLATMEEMAAENMTGFTTNAEQLYKNFMSQVRKN
jgi:hypothetical protein